MKETVRTVGSGVFCEPCLETRLNKAAGAPQAAGYAQPVPPIPSMEKLPSPVLAGLLSIIPGVGQFYNGQYAKGIVILLICAVLDSISKTSHLGFFGVVAFGWWVYQIVDAYQTAKARVEGRPLPNPFDLNDIGERLGFGKGFGTSAETRAAAYGTAPVTPPPTANWAGYVPPAPPNAPPNAPYTAPVPPPAYSSVPPAPPMPPMPPMPASGSSFPLVAIWLIGLGVLFTLMEVIPDMRINASIVTAIVLGAVAATVIVRRLGFMGGLHYPGTMLHMMRWPVILAVWAVLFLLQGVHAATIGQTWPVFLLALGAVLLGERLGVEAQPYPQQHDAGPMSVVPPASEAATTSTTTSEAEQNNERDGYTR
jgi:TM2 domain-containing membrane protein YozV